MPWARCVLLGGVLAALGIDPPRPYPEDAWGSMREYMPLEDEPAYEVTPIADHNPPLEPMNKTEGRTQGNHDVYQRVTIKGREWWDPATGLMYVVPNPMETFSVKGPLEGCGNGLFTPRESAAGKCLVATNAGFFNTHNGSCHGTVISDGEVLEQTDEMNASFGVTEDGEIVVGYLTEDEKDQMNFRQLVNGVVWIVRNGTSYIDEALVQEDMDTQESGSGDYFRSVTAARLALGHDADGRIFVLAIDGASGRRSGVDLDFMARKMIEAGAVNAINLDGGGSVGVFEGDVLANTPSDDCDKNEQGWLNPLAGSAVCARRVSSILCIHEPHYGVTPAPPTAAPPTPAPPTAAPSTPSPPTSTPPTPAPATPRPPTPNPPTPTPSTSTPPTPAPPSPAPQTPAPALTAPSGGQASPVLIALLFTVGVLLLLHLAVYIAKNFSCSDPAGAGEVATVCGSEQTSAAPPPPRYGRSSRMAPVQHKKFRRKKRSRYQHPERAIVDLELVGTTGYESSSAGEDAAASSNPLVPTDDVVMAS
eukprot:TRINITY_DN2332_c0_g1_i1.p1 TRINITY_DN2332_c0_g1~~TRINITY_DN2332_c0_g1_i1.p1  ORF type:complete len:550 (+),score=107.43 TRINITY_DN2332_c0_g1_i1:49-1650(+)